MARFPKIQSPCPVRDSLADYMEGDMCSRCDRQVHDLRSMSEAQKESFLATCSGEVCVSYSVPISKLAAATALSAAVMALPVAAQDKLVDLEAAQPAAPTAVCEDDVITGGLRVSTTEQNAYLAIEDYEDIIVVVGGIKDLANVEYVDDDEDLKIPELPVTYEDADS